jgi:hypothetical protein
MGGFLSGRVTHELMAGFWPTADKDPASTAPPGGAPALAGVIRERAARPGSRGWRRGDR